MKYRRMGNSGLIVSELSLGTMQFGRKMNMGNLGQEETTALVRHAIDRGVNLIDTADVYSLGESEELVGKALGGIREEIVLATKCRLPMSENFNRSGSTRHNILRGVESSLRRLQTDYIDLFQLHGWDSHTPLEETVRAMDDLVRSGKVRYIGICNYLAWQMATALGLQERLNLHPFVTAQMYYSLAGRGLEDEFLSMAEYHDLGILVWSPLAGGFLSGKYQPGQPPPEGTRFQENGNFVPIEREQGFRAVEAARRVAERHGVSVARVSLAWLLTRPAVSSVIVAGRRTDQIDDNLAASDLELTGEDLRELDEATRQEIPPYPKWMVLQLDVAEDPRPKVLHPERYADGGPWRDRREFGWQG